jgi:hypothetical protein
VARVWQIQEAKNKLSEVVEEAIQHGPLTLKKNRTNLAQFFLESPLRDSELDLTRDRRPAGRDISL